MLPPFQELVDRYWRDVARLTAALAGPEDADDAAQRAWLNALRAYPELKHGRNLRGWLLTVAARAATDMHRDRARRPVPVAAVPEAARVGPDAGQRAESYDASLWDLVRALPDRKRTAIGLRYALDLPHAEIAAALGCTETTSRRLVSDGLAALRAEMTRMGGTGTEPTDEEAATR